MSAHSHHQAQASIEPQARLQAPAFSLQHILMEGKLLPLQPPTAATSLKLPVGFWEEDGFQRINDELCMQFQADLRW